MLTWSSGGLLLAFVGVSYAAWVVMTITRVQANRAELRGDGVNPATYGFDLSGLADAGPRLATLQRLGDGVITFDASPPPGKWPNVMAPTVITPQRMREKGPMGGIMRNAYQRFVLPSDKVFGLTVNGESRAYPIRVLALHEVVNDTLGGVPVAITYSPLTDSPRAFDRRLNGQTLSLGFSGLVLDNNLLLYDRSDTPTLFSQLAGAGLSGPLAGQKLTSLGGQLVTWELWNEELATNSTIFAGQDGAATRYKKENPFEDYWANPDELLYPIGRDPPEGIIPKERSLLIRAGGESLLVPLGRVPARQEGVDAEITLGGVRIQLELIGRPGQRCLWVIPDAAHQAGVEQIAGMIFALHALEPDAPIWPGPDASTP